MPNASRAELELGELRKVMIDASRFYNRTGILLIQSGVYSFKVDPVELWYDAQNSCNAEGYPSIGGMRYFEWARRVPRENWFKLIGCVGMETTAIGTSLPTFTPAMGGELTCFANDAYLMYWNNRGSVALSVTRIG